MVEMWLEQRSGPRVSMEFAAIKMHEMFQSFKYMRFHFKAETRCTWKRHSEAECNAMLNVYYEMNA